MLWALDLLQQYSRRTRKHRNIEISGLTVSKCRPEPGCHSSSSSFSPLAHSHTCVCAWFMHDPCLGLSITYKQPPCSASPFLPPLTLSLCCGILLIFDHQKYGNLGRNKFMILFLKKKKKNQSSCLRWLWGFHLWFSETSNKRFMGNFWPSQCRQIFKVSFIWKN